MTTATLRQYDDQLASEVAVAVAVPGAVVGGEVGDAISMPAAFAALVQAELEIMMLAGPVVGDDGSWTFLTQPANSPAPAVPADLLAVGVRLIPTGWRVPLPAPEGSGPARWVAGPDREPAIWSTVIGAARRVAERARRQR